MKKTYSKPEILFDDFTLSTNIAAGCAVPTDTPHWNTCGIDFGGYSAFTSGITGCQIHITDGTNGFCYHVPTDTTKLFNSL